MNKLTRTQTLALFLGVASAQLNPIDVITGPATTAKIPTGQTATLASSGATCTANKDCTTAGESCAAFQRKGLTTENICINAKYCGSLGRINNVYFAVECFQTPAAGATATIPATIDAEADFLATQTWITKQIEDDTTGAKSWPWDGAKNLFVSGRYDMQDGWWILAETGANAGKWVETDKPIDNRCYLNNQCLPVKDKTGASQTRCCGTYPDTNNRRCMLRSLDKTKVKVGRQEFVATCAVEDTGADLVPTDAKTDLNETALAEASEEVNTWRKGLKADYLKDQKYDTLTADQQKAVDKAWADIEKTYETDLAAFKKKAGYDDAGCDSACKKVFQNDLLRWQKLDHTNCKTSAQLKTIECREKVNIFLDEIAAKVGGTGDKNFYKNMSKAEQDAFDKNWLDQSKKLASTLAAAWVAKQPKPTAGQDGFSCEKKDADGKAVQDKSLCTGVNQCCGTTKPVIGENIQALWVPNICWTMDTKEATKIAYTSALNLEFNHFCNAEGALKKVVASAAAAGAMAYALM